jgi:hypothetical protein
MNRRGELLTTFAWPSALLGISLLFVAYDFVTFFGNCP